MSKASLNPTTERPADPSPPAGAGVYTAHAAGHARRWYAVVKQDGREVWRSEQAFTNRDETTPRAIAARAVAHGVVRFLNCADHAAELAKDERYFAQHGYRFPGAREKLAIIRKCADIAAAIRERAVPTPVAALAERRGA